MCSKLLKTIYSNNERKRNNIKWNISLESIKLYSSIKVTPFAILNPYDRIRKMKLFVIEVILKIISLYGK